MGSLPFRPVAATASAVDGVAPAPHSADKLIDSDADSMGADEEDEEEEEETAGMAHGAEEAGGGARELKRCKTVSS